MNVLSAAQKHGVPRVVNTSTGGAIYGEGRTDPGAGGPPGRARGALRPLQVLRRAVLRDLHPPARALHRLAALRQRLRPAPGPARRGRRDRDLLRQAARGRQGHDLRQRRADARLRVRRGRGGRQPARRRVRRHRADQHRPRPAEERARHRRGAAAISPTTASQPEHAPERPGEVQHIALDPSRAREALGWEAKVELDEGLEAGRSTACAERP